MEIEHQITYGRRYGCRQARRTRWAVQLVAAHQLLARQNNGFRDRRSIPSGHHGVGGFVGPYLHLAGDRPVGVMGADDPNRHSADGPFPPDKIAGDAVAVVAPLVDAGSPGGVGDLTINGSQSSSRP